jgi:hypothetical protein
MLVRFAPEELGDLLKRIQRGDQNSRHGEKIHAIATGRGHRYSPLGRIASSQVNGLQADRPRRECSRGQSVHHPELTASFSRAAARRASGRRGNRCETITMVKQGATHVRSSGLGIRRQMTIRGIKGRAAPTRGQHIAHKRSLEASCMGSVRFERGTMMASFRKAQTACDRSTYGDREMSVTARFGRSA